jgi:hypothetical protein
MDKFLFMERQTLSGGGRKIKKLKKKSLKTQKGGPKQQGIFLGSFL